MFAPSGLTQDAPGVYRGDLGTLDPLRTPTVERTFSLRNTGPQAVTIGGLRGSCGCETLLLTRKGAETKQITLAPGDAADIHLSIRLNPYSSGAVRKYVWAFGPGAAAQATPLVTIALDLRVEASIAFTPPSVNFGTVTAGQAATQPLTVTVRQDMLTTSGLPPLVSTNPEVSVQTVGAAQAVTVDGRPAQRRLYMLSLSPDTPAGPIAGDVRLTVSARPGAQGPLIQTVAVLGTVSSSLVATPATVFFGSLPYGASPVRAFVLTLPAGTAGTPLVSADKPWVTVTLSPASGTSGRRLINVSLRKDAPVGDIQATVTASVGRLSLSIPVIAELTK